MDHETRPDPDPSLPTTSPMAVPPVDSTTGHPAASTDPDHDTGSPDEPGEAAATTRSTTGRVGEQLACDHLGNLGMEVVARNWRICDGDLRGELDVVALDHAAGVVVIVEVKTRRGAGFGGALAAVDGRKRAKLRRLAMALLSEARLPYRDVRFDVVAVRLDTRHLHHVMDAL